jgi:hypothetical protein
MDKKLIKEIEQRITKIDNVILKRLEYIEKLHSKYISYKGEIESIKVRYNNYLTKGE